MKRIPSLDGFRAISIILVLIHHSRLTDGFPHFFDDMARQAEVGVTIFFVISGFLITGLLLAEESRNGKINLTSFYIRRALRILPVYGLYLAFIVFWRNFENIGLTKNNLAHVLTFTVNFDLKKCWYVWHFWSLSVEEQFYLFWPALLILSRKHLKIVLVLLVAYSCIARVIAYKFPDYQNLFLGPFFTYSDSIFVGAFGGIVYFENAEIVKHKIFNSLPAKLVALSLFLSFLYFTEHGMLAQLSLPFGRTIVSISALFFMLSYITPSDKIVFKLLNHKWIVHIGILSYSIYIWQQLFFVGEIRGLWRTFPYNIVVIYAVSLASYYLWEKPFLNIKKHFSAKKLQPIN